MIYKKSKVAFTLTEVLVTLGIIGVVSAITIPTLINKYQEHVTVNKVKKFYSMINQALLMSIKNNGYIDEWQYTNVTEFAGYLKPYLKIIKDCGTRSGCITIDNYKYLDDSINATNYNTNKYYKMILADNSYMWFRKSQSNNSCVDNDGGWNNVCGLLYFDINGKKAPNTIGKDLFIFYFQKNRIVQYNLNASDCNKNLSGWACSGYILTNGNMDYLHE